MKNIIILLFFFYSLNILAQGNSQWRGDNRDGIYPDTMLLDSWPNEGPKMLWHYDDLGPGQGSAAVTDEHIYIAGSKEEDGFVIKFDLNGNIIWKEVYGKEWMESYDGVRTTPAIIGEDLYIMSAYGVIYCMDIKDGSIKWNVDYIKTYEGNNIKWGVTENLLIYDDKVVCTPGGKDANVIALNRHDGSLVWKCSGKGEISAYCSPALINHNDRKIVVTQTKESVLAIDAQDGELLWTLDYPNRWSVHANTPLYHDGKILIESGYGKGSVLLKLSEDASSYEELWRNELLDGKLGGAVLLDGKIYGSGDKNRKWFCVDWESGEVLYSNKDFKKGNIISAEGLLYWYSQNGKVALVKPEIDSFKIKGEFKVPYGDDQHWAHLVIANKKLFVRHGESLMVYSLEKQKEISEWRGLGRTGVYHNENNLLKSWPEKGPELLWYNDSIPNGYASIAVANDLVYTTGIEDEMDVVIAFDPYGDFKWKTAFGRKWDSSYDESRSTPTVENERLYVFSGFGDIACLNAISGELIWQKQSQELYGAESGKFGFSESLLIVDEKIVFTSGGAKTTIVALDKTNGNMIWESPSLNDEASYSSPLLIENNGKKAICNYTKNYFFGIDAENGELLWNFDLSEYGKGNAKTNTPLFYDSCFFLTSGYDHKSIKLKLANDSKSLEVLWVDTLLDVHHGGVVLIDGYLYGANWENNRNGKWTCLNWETGELMFEEEWINKGPIISADGMLYCYAEKEGTIGLVKVNPEKFELVSSFTIPYGKGPHWAHPVIDKGRLYIRHANAIMVYDISEKQKL